VPYTSLFFSFVAVHIVSDGGLTVKFINCRKRCGYH